MPSPIQYVPQFIPTDIGAISNVLDRRQAEYDAGYAAPLMYEDKYSQIPVSPENITGKQAILDSFKDRIQKVVDRYGGDYGAASKDITREIAKERQNPFYQMAPQHYQAMQRQQALKDKYGAFAIPLKETPGQFISPEGVVSQDINLNPVILNQQDLEKKVLTEYGKRASKINQSGLYKTKYTPEGFYQQTTTKGVTEEELPALIDDITDSLYKMNPDLAAAIDAGDPRARQIAENMARQMIGGQTIDYQRDPAYIKSGSGSKVTDPFNIPLIPTTTLGMKNRESNIPELKNVKEVKKIDSSSNPIAQAFKRDFDKTLINDNVLEQHGITDKILKYSNVDADIITRNQNGTIDTKKTLNNIEKYLGDISLKDINESKLSISGDYWGPLKDDAGNIIEEGDKSFKIKAIKSMTPEERLENKIPDDWEILTEGKHDWERLNIPSPRKQKALEEQNQLITNYNKLKRFQDFYDLSLKSAIEDETTDWAVDFYDFDLAGADAAMRRNITNLTDQYNRMNADDFVFLTAPKDANVLVDGSEKKQDKYKREHELRSKGSFIPVGIGSLSGEGIIFRVKDKNGEEYTVKPRNPQTVLQMGKMFGNSAFLSDEIDNQIKTNINNNINNFGDDTTYEDLVSRLQTPEERNIYYEFMKRRGLTLDSKIESVK